MYHSFKYRQKIVSSLFSDYDTRIHDTTSKIKIIQICCKQFHTWGTHWDNWEKNIILNMKKKKSFNWKIQFWAKFGVYSKNVVKHTLLLVLNCILKFKIIFF